MGLSQVQHTLEAVERYSVKVFGKRFVGAIIPERLLTLNMQHGEL